MFEEYSDLYVNYLEKLIDFAFEDIISAVCFTTLFTFCKVIHDGINSKKKFTSLPEIETIAYSSEITATHELHFVKNAAIILQQFKASLPANQAKKISQIGYIRSASGRMSGAIMALNLDRKDIANDKHAILLGESLLKELTPAELKAVLAHEAAHITLAHTDNKDLILRYINKTSISAAYNFALITWAVSAINIYKPQESLPVLFMLLTTTLVILKLFSFYSQNLEFQADKESLRFNKDTTALISAAKKADELTEKNATTIDHICMRFFRSHPDARTREQALSFAKEEDSNRRLGALPR